MLADKDCKAIKSAHTLSVRKSEFFFFYCHAKSDSD